MSWIDFLFPKSCLNCKRVGVYICRNCTDKVRLLKDFCPECNKASIDGFTHVKCQRNLGLNGLLSIWRYEGVVKKATLATKYKYAREVGRELSLYLIKELQDKKFLYPNHYFLVPIPLHWHRENQRGFNQSHLIGKEISKAFNWKFLPNLIVRKKTTPPQVGLKGKERIKNVKNVFEFKENKAFMAVNPRNVILFDDVYTTGSTLKEATKVLKRGGVEKVWGLTIAR